MKKPLPVAAGVAEAWVYPIKNSLHDCLLLNTQTNQSYAF